VASLGAPCVVLACHVASCVGPAVDLLQSWAPDPSRAVVLSEVWKGHTTALNPLGVFPVSHRPVICRALRDMGMAHHSPEPPLRAPL